MTQNNLRVIKADKGNMLIIIHQDEYNNKVDEFIMNNSFEKVTKDDTNIQQKTIRGAINTCSNIIRYADKLKYVNMVYFNHHEVEIIT
jgi:hypothetical protein